MFIKGGNYEHQKISWNSNPNICFYHGMLRNLWKNKQTGTENKMTLAELRENWEEYTIYYSGRWDSRPAAIMFDPKNDDKKLVGDSWHKIEDQETLSETISTI